MKPDAQRIAIAEACGWKWKPELLGLINGPHHESGARNVPDYPNDLNAMRAACVAIIHPNENWRRRFMDHLYRICEHQWMMTDATAAQRAEALLKTLGKWEGDK